MDISCLRTLRNSSHHVIPDQIISTAINMSPSILTAPSIIHQSKRIKTRKYKKIWKIMAGMLSDSDMIKIGQKLSLLMRTSLGKDKAMNSLHSFNINSLPRQSQLQPALLSMQFNDMYRICHFCIHILWDIYRKCHFRIHITNNIYRESSFTMQIGVFI